ncbi:hypothetical protein CLAFUW4_08144 [Fulvia fulva]|uniref:F-box domain-containing protein n=1 Tax=Passalora fulva TaxID=5499 RepID=A0A9Q8LD41_PASFU|nr:uncharacterized protein CLAFUR5_08258 [Fulvia fulva]KAK4628933.1 hypothetical protein CLAFUR4_08149 [Fulvia fulva]KAK4630814.1 hypothetical protein CLAFUR0_08144 [Fulvia fulva]UJO15024.1 hypothetical protein CLAFUR5_08258 [Fulvia fulva]WPV12106.1 hypothetical protein CLAFUW4_08144 [Fulvia fulva]WPV27961.1 hypothetical protein CLAFUW7_08144 [Fulvia fulva]
MASDHSKRDIFPFFDLPREMRDSIYLHLGISSSKTRLMHNDGWDPDDEDSKKPIEDLSVIRLRIENVCRSNVLCVSRQFKQEYEEQLSKATTIVFTDHKGNEVWKLLDMSDKKFGDVKQAKYYGYIQCTQCPDGPQSCQVGSDIDDTIAWLQVTLGHLATSSKVTIVVVLRWSGSMDLRWPQSPHRAHLEVDFKKLASVPRVSAIEVYRDNSGVDDFDVEAQVLAENLYVSWTAKDGWQAPVAAANAMEESKEL